MVMALARGGTLEQRLRREGSLPAPIVERLLIGCSRDSSRFIRRDSPPGHQPANIILDAKNNPT